MRDESLSLYEFVGRLYMHLKDFEGTLDEAHEKIDEFITRFDTKLDKTTKKILTEWHDDGTLAELINLVWAGKAEQILAEWKNDGTLAELINLVWEDKADKTYVDGLEQDFNQHKIEYVKYINSELGFVLRELPNGVKDEIRVSGGKAEHVKRVKKYVLQASDITKINRFKKLTDYANVKKPEDYIGYGTYTYNDTLLEGFIEFKYDFDQNNTGKYSSAALKDNFWVGFPKGTTLEQVRQQLVGLTLTYQLAEPIITELTLDDLSPNTQQIVQLSSKVEKLTNAIIALGGTIV